MAQQNKWQVDSWQRKRIWQQPVYEDQEKLSRVLAKITELAPLVTSSTVEFLKRQIAEAADGKRFLLQGGDCAERFADCRRDAITNKIKILLQMSVILSDGARKPVIRVGRIAGQYAKPRSADYEEIDGNIIAVFRGDNINSYEATVEARRPDPERLLKSYDHAALTLNYIRDIIAGVKEEIFGAVDFYTSHEGLLLCYEQAMTRFCRKYQRFYNLGTHMLWLGDRTRQLHGGHVEYFRGIANPIAIKVGPSATGEEIVELINILNPQEEPGKITLITRFGSHRVNDYLPGVIEFVNKAGLKVLWSCDPMHGNLIKTEQGIKTRNFDDILSELKQTFDIHKQMNGQLGGVHFELTGDNVTECIGGMEGLKPHDLNRNYETYCDPRLNYTQSLEMAFLSSAMLRS